MLMVHAFILSVVPLFWATGVMAGEAARFPPPPEPEAEAPVAPARGWFPDLEKRRQRLRVCDTLLRDQAETVQRLYSRMNALSYDRGPEGYVPAWVIQETYFALLALMSQAERRFRDTMFGPVDVSICQAVHNDTVVRAAQMVMRATGRRPQ